jgi:hypothetical protein
MPNAENILPHRWKPGGPSPNPGGRPSSRMAIEHAMRETSDGKEIVERLVALMRSGKQESTRLKAACELRDWLFGSPSPDHALALGGTLSEVRGEIVRFSAAFGPSMSRGAATDADGGTASDATTINVSGIATDDEEVIDAEAPADMPDSPENPE